METRNNLYLELIEKVASVFGSMRSNHGQPSYVWSHFDDTSNGQEKSFETGIKVISVSDMSMPAYLTLDQAKACVPNQPKLIKHLETLDSIKVELLIDVLANKTINFEIDNTTGEPKIVNLKSAFDSLDNNYDVTIKSASLDGHSWQEFSNLEKAVGRDFVGSAVADALAQSIPAKSIESIRLTGSGYLSISQRDVQAFDHMKPKINSLIDMLDGLRSKYEHLAHSAVIKRQYLQGDEDAEDQKDVMHQEGWDNVYTLAETSQFIDFQYTYVLQPLMEMQENVQRIHSVPVRQAVLKFMVAAIVSLQDRVREMMVAAASYEDGLAYAQGNDVTEASNAALKPMCESVKNAAEAAVTLRDSIDSLAKSSF